MSKLESKDNNAIYNVVGKNIKKYRKLRGLKQAELANLCCLSIGYIADLESDTFRTISLNTMCVISKQLSIHPKQLLDDLEEDSQ